MIPRQRLITYIQIWVLFILAVSQPLLNLLSRSAEFFIVRNSMPLDLIVLVFALCFAVPLLLCFLVWFIGKFNSHLETLLGYTIIAFLLGVFMLPGLKQTVNLPGILAISISLLLGAGVAEGIRRYKTISTFLIYLAPAIVVVPALFLLDSRITKILKPDQGLFTSIRIESKTPVVLIVFDEFPVTSIMDYGQKIDHVRYPNFARLLENSTWFRNATTSAAGTGDSLTTMLTGVYPNKKLLPTASDYPRNLFTLLGSSYDLHAVENGTKFFPGSLRSTTETEQFTRRMKSLILDLSAIFLQIVLPADFSESFPRVSQTWGSFWDQGRLGDAKPPENAIEPPQIFEKFLSSFQNSNKPGLYFHHLMLPHVPWKYLPSGMEYEYRYFGYFGVDGLTRFERWINDDWVVSRGYQRHLLQVGYVDRLLGSLIEKLKQTGLYDRSLIIITADHGASFCPGMPRRDVTSATYQDILPVPLFVKLPGQESGNTNDRNVETIDILPTIVDALKIPVGWKFEGTSVFRQTNRARKTVYIGPEKLHFEPQLARKNDSLKRKLELFGSGTTQDRLYKNGPFAGIIDHPVEELGIQTADPLQVKLNDPALYERVDFNSRVLPIFITGRTISKTSGPIYLGIAVNGTLRAVTRTFAAPDGQGFGALVPERSFHSGRNEIRVLPLKAPQVSKLSTNHPVISDSP